MFGMCSAYGLYAFIVPPPCACDVCFFYVIFVDCVLSLFVSLLLHYHVAVCNCYAIVPHCYSLFAKVLALAIVMQLQNIR